MASAPKAVSEIAESCAEDVFEQAMQTPKDMREHVARFGARAAAAIAARNIVGHDVKAFETLVVETVLKRIREAA